MSEQQFKPGSKVQWEETRKRKRIEIITGEIITISRDYAYIKASKNSPRMIRLSRIKSMTKPYQEPENEPAPVQLPLF